MTIYTSKDGETLDYIVWKHYGKTTGILEQVLVQNRHLAIMFPDDIVQGFAIFTCVNCHNAPTTC